MILKPIGKPIGHFIFPKLIQFMKCFRNRYVKELQRGPWSGASPGPEQPSGAGTASEHGGSGEIGCRDLSEQQLDMPNPRSLPCRTPLAGGTEVQHLGVLRRFCKTRRSRLNMFKQIIVCDM